MSRSKFVSDAEYHVILSKVNQVICQFSKSADKSRDAMLFMTRIEEKCTSREEFYSVIEKRLDLLSNPNKSQEYVDWFISKRSSLVTLLQHIKEKLVADPGYLNKYTPSFAKGMQCLDKLLKMNVEEIGHKQMVDLTRIQKAMYELNGGIKQKPKLPEEQLSPAGEIKLSSELMRQLITLNDKIVNGEELNTLQQQLRSELSALLTPEIAEKNKSRVSDANPLRSEAGNDSVNDPVHVMPAAFRTSSCLGQSNSAGNDTNESLNDPVDCSPNTRVVKSVTTQSTQTTVKELNFDSFSTSAPFDAGAAWCPNTHLPVGAQEGIIRDQAKVIRTQEVWNQEHAKYQEQAK